MAVKIAVHSASFSYGQKTVWQNISFDVEKGETLSILGPNGCGKTTLLNCIHGNLKLKDGDIRIDDQDIQSINVMEIAQKIGYVFQEHSAPFPYSSLQIVKMGRAPHLGIFQSPTFQDTAMALKVMEDMGISHLAYRRYTELSGGERQLVLIARTLCQDPEIILFDEPTSHLDFKNQALVLQTLSRLAAKGFTIIMTSHFPNHAWLLSSKVAMMRPSGFVAVGLAEEVMTEENLSDTYGMHIKLYKGVSGDSTINFCTPEFNLAQQ